MSNKKKKILFIKHLNDLSFIENDYQILSKRYKVTAKSFYQSKTRSRVGQYLFLLMKIIELLRYAHFDLVYIWFAGYHSAFVLRLFRFFKMKSIVVIGGYDAARDRMLNHGLLLNENAKKKVEKTCALADKLVAVSHFTKNQLQKNINLFIGNKITVIYNGVDSELFQIKKSSDRELILCVANIQSLQQVKSKSIDFYFELAGTLSTHKFAVVGLKKEALKWAEDQNLKNMLIFSDINHQKMPDIYNQAKVYCQFSKYESFGVALVEAMLCGCPSIVYRSTAANEIVDENNVFFLPKLELEQAIQILMRSLKLSPPADKIRSYALRYSLHNREKYIIKEIESLI